jgi:hypothetical protein
MEDQSKTEELGDIISKIPDNVYLLLITIVSCLMITLFTFAWLIKFPETVTSRIQITSLNPPVDLISNQTGKITIFLDLPKQKINKGDVIAIFQDIGELNIVDSLLAIITNLDSNKDYSLLLDEFSNFSHLSIGTIKGSLLNTIEALNFLNDFEEYDQYIEEIKNLNGRLFHLNQIQIKQSSSLKIKEQQLAIIKGEYEIDIQLFENKAILDNQLKNSQLRLLSVQQEFLMAQSSIIQTDLEIDNINKSLIQLSLNRKKELATAFLSVKSSIEILKIEIENWYKNNVIITPFTGVIENLNFWKQGQFIKAGTPLFTIIPEKNSLICHMLIPVLGSGRVAENQQVNIMLENYPYEDFGMLKGKITLVSDIIVEGNYLAEVELADSLTTTFNQSLNFDYGMIGTADIITKDRRYIERIFSKIKYIFDR